MTVHELEHRRAPLARGLAARLRDAVEAADRLAAFSYDLHPDGAPLSQMTDGEELATAHDMVLRVLRTAGDALNFQILAAACEQAGDETHPGAPLDGLACDLGLTRMALIERVHDLIQLGLVARDLQRDRVLGTPAGHGVLELITVLESDVATWLGKRRRR
jgi:hypothetical protein